MLIHDYEKQVYAAVSGKVFGVYLGRPCEGWSKERIAEEWGEVTRYIHEDRNVPLVVADDDISGTFTFIRALADSGAGADTPPEFYGETWLNYLIENKTVLWWGGISHSTEHTAYWRLKQGVPSPESGSMARNGKEVAEQIGGQIFIDAFGMVTPGNPQMAADLARYAAGVSHDGEAVYAAQVVAALVSLAFVEKDMNALLDQAVTFIPQDSLIAQVHRDVRRWAAELPDWNECFERIKGKYGYDRYGGNCHVIPNHAVMVMAWAYGQQDFYKALRISVSAGWDTDCNAANVGTVSALVAGLEHLDDTYDFRSPCGDRIVIPTAEGTFSVTDILTVSNAVAQLGRKIMGMEPVPASKNGALFSFEMPGAAHGFLPEEPNEMAKGNASARNIAAPAGFSGTRALEYRFRTGIGLTSAISKPLIAGGNSNAYQIIAVPLLFSGNTVRMQGRLTGDAAEVRAFLRTSTGEYCTSEPLMPDESGNVSLVWQTEFAGVAQSFGFTAAGEKRGGGVLTIDWIDFTGPSAVNSLPDMDYSGWISSMNSRRGVFSNDSDPAMNHWISNQPSGVLITGNRRWGNVEIQCNFAIHSAERAGVLCHYQGLRRWIGVIFTRTEVQIVRNLCGETVLARAPFPQQENRTIALTISAKNGKISVSADGKHLLETQVDSTLRCGGAGLLIGEGLAGLSRWSVTAQDAGNGMIF